MFAVNAQSVVQPMSFSSVYDSIANARDNYYSAAYMIKRNLDACVRFIVESFSVAGSNLHAITIAITNFLKQTAIIKFTK